MIIGITGHSGSGKTYACKTLASNNIAVIECDKVAREVSLEHLAELVLAFSEDIICDGKLDRKKLAKIVFSNSEKLELLNRIMFPHICTAISKYIEQYSNYPIILIDAPTLIESGAYKLCDIVIAILDEKEMRIQRIVERDNLTLQEATMRIDAQHSNDFYIEKADFVLFNSGDNLIDAIKEIIDAV